MNFKNPYFGHKRGFLNPLQPFTPTVDKARIEGKISKRASGGYTWDIDIFVGKEYLTSMKHPDNKPDFLTGIGALTDMKEQAEIIAKKIAKDAYDTEDMDSVIEFVVKEV